MYSSKATDIKIALTSMVARYTLLAWTLVVLLIGQGWNFNGTLQALAGYGGALVLWNIVNAWLKNDEDEHWWLAWLVASLINIINDIPSALPFFALILMTFLYHRF